MSLRAEGVAISEITESVPSISEERVFVSGQVSYLGGWFFVLLKLYSGFSEQVYE